VTYNEFLEIIVTGGIEAATRDYDPGDKRNGAIAGFQACIGKSPAELKDLLDASRIATRDARNCEDKYNYWWFRCYELEVEWVCNCLSALLMHLGEPVIIQPTARGTIKAGEVLQRKG
jgi:hypothetical protein